MSFDIKAHLQNHAYYFKQYREITNKDLHFTWSYEDLQFFDRKEAPEELLQKLLEKLKEEVEYKVKNGWDTLKNGEKVQRYAKRKVNLQEDIKIEAIHVKGSLGEHTHPHIHLILKADGRYGKNYSLLRQHISKISEKMGLIPHFDEIKENRLKNLHDSIKRFFWLLKKKNSKELKEYFFKEKNKELLSKMLDKLEQYTKQTNNTLFYFKTLQSLQKRLQDNKIDFYWNGHNIREIIPVENILTENDFKVIELINNKSFNQKDIKEYIKNPILRDFARYSYYRDLKKSFIIKALKETTLLKNPQPNQKLLKNFLKLYERQNRTKKRKSQLSKEDNLALFFKNKLLEVAKKSINEKELRDNLLSEYNIQLKLKKRKGKVIGYTFIKDNQEHYFKQSEIIEISKLREILKQNQNTQEQKTLPVKLPVVYKKEMKYEELQRFSKRAGSTIARANITKYAITEEIKRTERLNRENKEQIRREDTNGGMAKRNISITKETITRIRNAISRIGGTISTIKSGIRSIKDKILSATRKKSGISR